MAGCFPIHASLSSLTIVQSLTNYLCWKSSNFRLYIIRMTQMPTEKHDFCNKSLHVKNTQRSQQIDISDSLSRSESYGGREDPRQLATASNMMYELCPASSTICVNHNILHQIQSHVTNAHIWLCFRAAAAIMNRSNPKRRSRISLLDIIKFQTLRDLRDTNARKDCTRSYRAWHAFTTLRNQQNTDSMRDGHESLRVSKQQRKTILSSSLQFGTKSLAPIWNRFGRKPCPLPIRATINPGTCAPKYRFGDSSYSHPIARADSGSTSIRAIQVTAWFGQIGQTSDSGESGARPNLADHHQFGSVADSGWFRLIRCLMQICTLAQPKLMRWIW